MAAALAIAVVVQTPAMAHDTDDWGNGETQAPDNWNYRAAESIAGNVHQKTAIWWSKGTTNDSGHNVAVRASVSDREEDGYCGAVQIRYEIRNPDGSWAGHWHYRQVAGAVDRTTNGVAVSSAYFFSKYLMRNVQARACHATSGGVIKECEANFH
ncbi:hypothetical protein ACFQ1S_06250 [Kibdelosporangium lantanae]|uniref:Uncharacterized protein n=1 Tax=Kibdelosporangium lantanae TaxID=1497396 RepID=A0ABW3M8I6_9PSEU